MGNEGIVVENLSVFKDFYKFGESLNEDFKLKDLDEKGLNEDELVDILVRSAFILDEVTRFLGDIKTESFKKRLEEFINLLEYFNKIIFTEGIKTIIKLWYQIFCIYGGLSIFLKGDFFNGFFNEEDFEFLLNFKNKSKKKAFRGSILNAQSKYELLKGLFSLGTHFCIANESGEYKSEKFLNLTLDLINDILNDQDADFNNKKEYILKQLFFLY